MRNNVLQNITHKSKNWATRIPLKTRDELKCTGKVSNSASSSGTDHGTLVAFRVISHERTWLLLRQTEYIRCHLWYKYSVSSNKKSWRWPYNLLVPSTVIFRKELSCWRKSNSIKATFPLGWSHRYKNSTVVITNWLTRWEISISQMTTDLFPFRRLLSFLYYRTWRYE